MSSKTKNKALCKYIHCDICKTGVLIFIGDCNSLREYARKTYKYDYCKDILDGIMTSCTEEEYYKCNVSARTYDSDSGCFLIHLPKFSFSYDPIEISTLDHELLHATFLIGDYMGIEYHYRGNNEFYTYLHEFLLKEALIKKGYNKV